MRRFNVLAVAAMMAATCMAQSDPVLMTINGKQITRSEFEYSFNKNNSDGVIDKKSIEDYVPLFVDFKLKVAAAEEARYDTIASLQKELRGYKEQLVMPTIVDNDFIEKEARATYENTAKRFDGQDLLTASHILVLLRQDATPEQEAAAKNRIDSIFNVLKGGADFAKVAQECSDDKGSAAKGGQLGQFGKGMMIPDFENAAYALKAGEMSTPFKSTVGWHIILMHDRHPFESYEFHHESIIKFLEQRGIKEASAEHYVDSIAKMKGITREAVIDEKFNELINSDPEMKFLSQEYYDGTLMYEICKKEIWDVAAKDEAGLENYFNKNKKQYAWDSPRFKGIVMHMKEGSSPEVAKKLIKGVKDDAEWGKILVKEFNTDSVKNIRIEHGIYKQGENVSVDVYAFGEQKELKPMKDFPVTDIYGRLIKKPESYKDVKGQVTTDYQNAMEKAWVETLRKKYSYSVDNEVLKTVNNH